MLAHRIRKRLDALEQPRHASPEDGDRRRRLLDWAARDPRVAEIVERGCGIMTGRPEDVDPDGLLRGFAMIWVPARRRHNAVEDSA